MGISPSEIRPENHSECLEALVPRPTIIEQTGSVRLSNTFGMHHVQQIRKGYHTHPVPGWAFAQGVRNQK